MLYWPSFIFGSLPNQESEIGTDFRDYIACARRHSGAKSVLKVDIKDFFDNITQDLVEEIFSEVFKYPPSVCNALSNLCCYEGRVIQGALTSSYLAALSLHNVEGRVVARLAHKRLTYTRYVDDITVSSTDVSANFDFALSIIREMAESKDLPLNATKTAIHRISSAPLVIHGLRISSKCPRLQISELSRIRAVVRRTEQLAKEPNYRTSFGYRKDFNRSMGLVNKLARVGHSQHKSLVARLKAIEPLPSKKDIKRIHDMIARMLRDSTSKRNTYWYRARFFKTQERINILQRTFKREAAAFRLQMKALSPL
jgi:RNA-directed DNA polymerase